jgi:uncharacterized protein (TIGR00297 family)
VIGIPGRIGAPTLLWQLGLGLVLSGAIGLLAYRRAALSMSGAAGAALTGTLIFGFGGWVWGALLITFFVLSTLLSKYKQRTKESLAEKFAKGSRRDLGQVLANGGAGALLAIAYALDGSPAWFFAFCGALAAVNADTWATELGVLSRRPPRLITNGRVVERGTSGGVSPAGMLATLGGGAVIGLAAVVFGGLGRLAGIAPDLPPIPATALLGAGAVSGLIGSLFDSLLGATVQAIYYAPNRAKETEKPVDPDGTRNRHIRGWLWMNNDWVNFLSSLVGAATAATVRLVLS